ncbi:MAG TPA: CRISPR-associated helicase Cas3' [Candidatus Hydrogenedentes bacterium]|nr:CRISPR-associated helicase Cas3' [Candidatus Hydrogenedentota bacterium]
MNFDQQFEQLTRHPSPRDWQRTLAASPICRNQLVRVPTGLGKTEGVLAAWIYHRLHRSDDAWPRRLVWCLPMRVLVEQTEQVARELAERVPAAHRPTVHVAMGGKDVGEWFLYPERPAIIIGTQDMLLSRALNRGYASGRARWPMEFGLLNHDALWVLDEVQLMDVGLATSAQLQAFRDEDCEKGLRPCHTWWMSATLQPEWLRSVDTSQHHENWISNPCQVASTQRHGGLWDIAKSLSTDTINADDCEAFAKRILKEHADLPADAFGRITLVVCNTVKRACETFDSLQKEGRTEGIELVHSRFRPTEREIWRERFLSKSACNQDVDRIIVATQVVEAGVDISAGCLITDLAPWSSLVQRFGRCARYGGSGKVLVVDRGRDGSAAPYQPIELDSAWEALQQLPTNGVGIEALEAYQESLDTGARARLYPYTPAHLLMRREFDELFDTTPDLTGADLDISRFIRSGEERDLQVFWINIEKDIKGEKPKKPPENYRPHRRELCAVPFLEARDWLCGKETKTNRKPKLRGGIRAWIWDWIDGEWKVAVREALIPGQIVCVSADSGGYRTDRGFDADSQETVPPVSFSAVSEEAQALDDADNQQDTEIPGSCWKTIACHSTEVANESKDITTHLGLPQHLQDILELASLWHDWGKSHPAFQGCMRDANRPDRNDLAKAPDGCWPKRHRYKYLDRSETRPAFRHELASALGLFAILQTYAPQHPALLGPWSEALAILGRTPVVRELLPVPSLLIQRLVDCSSETFDLLAYLVASHHGKVRVALHAAPMDQDYRDRDGRGLPIRGAREGDLLPSVILVPDEPAAPESTLTLSPAAIGLSENTGISWRERSLRLIDRYGPGGLAFLEAVLRAADVRASRLKTTDPAIYSEAQP